MFLHYSHDNGPGPASFEKLNGIFTGYLASKSVPRVMRKAQFYILLMFLFQKSNHCLFLEMEERKNHKTVVEKAGEMARRIKGSPHKNKDLSLK